MNTSDRTPLRKSIIGWVTLSMALSIVGSNQVCARPQVPAEMREQWTKMNASDGKVLMEAFNARIHDLETIPNKPIKAIDMKMVTVPQPGEGIMPDRGLNVTGFDKKGQALIWDFKEYAPDLYDVVGVYHAGKNQKWEVGSSVRAHIAGQSVENQLIESKRVETITVPKPLMRQ